MDKTTITIQPIHHIEDARHIQDIQRRVWSAADRELVPASMLMTLSRNGSLVLAAYASDGPPDTGGMVGFVVGWLGTVPGTVHDGQPARLKHCSHIAGVLPDWQRHGVGRQLKLAQRQAVLDEGWTDHVTWTYDPLYRRNGAFNIHSLGAVSTTYIRNIYGEVNDALNAGIPTDRCQVDWYLRSPRVVQAIAEEAHTPGWNLATVQLLPTPVNSDGLTHPPASRPDYDGRPVALPLPDDVADLRQRDRQLLVEWRLYLREALEQAFASGYVLADCVRIGDKGWQYILTAGDE